MEESSERKHRSEDSGDEGGAKRFKYDVILLFNCLLTAAIVNTQTGLRHTRISAGKHEE